MKCAGSLLVVSVLMMAGCTTAPVQAPRAASAFTAPKEVASSPAEQARSAASAFYASALKKAEASDAANDFGVKADGLSIFAVTLAAGGALTGSKSKLYKAAGALLGLGMGSNQYFKPKDQRAIYFNTAESAYCSGLQMTILADQLKNLDTATIDNAKEAVRKNNETIRGVVYSGQIQSSDLQPFQAASIITAAMNSESDTAAQLAALSFIKAPQLHAHNRQLLLLRYEISEINKTAFKIDDTLDKIAKLSVGPTETLAALKSLDGASEPMTVPDEKDLPVDPVAALLKQLPEIIQTITDFNACTDVLKPVTTGT
ncbi:hypothetical protein [Stutzerimonas frequens]|uniref:hypothetical protein n=1 Tax=Stutzerimonas frequens TaxID=2968969 RepID=UPI0025538F8E|nr:hypothetical protein [Stutzerimonas frequens]MDL0441851.1 hypothetical protein [Stutzerimonas frequens]